jgi:RHS repeat-associated protein
MERDKESGLNYHTARYYAPWLGRWASCDPIGVRGGLNLFRYSNCNPVNHTDKNGQEPPEKNSQPAGRISFQAGIQVSAEAEGDSTKVVEYHLESGSGIVWTPEGSKLPALQLNKNENVWQPADLKGSTYIVEPKRSSTLQRLSNRGTAAVGLVFSGLEAYGGALIIAGSDGLATTPGWLLVVDASDKGAANAKQLITGETQHTLLYKGVRSLTGSDTAALTVDMALPLLIGGIPTRGPGLPTSTPPPSGPTIVKLSSDWKVNRAASAMSKQTGQEVVSLELGSLSKTGEATLIGHGIALEGDVGAIAVRLGNQQATAKVLAKSLVDAGWKGGTIRLAACQTGTSCLLGTTYANELATELRALGRESVVIGPGGKVNFINGQTKGIPQVRGADGNLLEPNQGWGYHVGD